MIAVARKWQQVTIGHGNCATSDGTVITPRISVHTTFVHNVWNMVRGKRHHKTWWVSSGHSYVSAIPVVSKDTGHRVLVAVLIAVLVVLAKGKGPNDCFGFQC